MAYGWFILILAGTIFLLATPYLFKLLKPRLSSGLKVVSPQNAEVFAEFSFAPHEWAHVYQREFVEDEHGKGFFDKYSGVISYDTIARKINGGRIFFTVHEIYLTDGEKGKHFTVNRLNSSGDGFHLSSIDLLYLKPLKKLRIKVSGTGISPESGELDYDAEYLVPLPEAAAARIDEILKTYGDIILNA